MCRRKPWYCAYTEDHFQWYLKVFGLRQIGWRTTEQGNYYQLYRDTDFNQLEMKFTFENH